MRMGWGLIVRFTSVYVIAVFSISIEWNASFSYEPKRKGKAFTVTSYNFYKSNSVHSSLLFAILWQLI